MEIVTLVIAFLILANTTFLTIMKIRQRTMKLTRGSLLLDTSAIMDGRIVDVAKTGIIAQELIIPRSVLNEMQLLADKADTEKRMRARRGMELVREIRALENVSVSIIQDGRIDRGGVDERLIELSRKTGASIATVDYNLNKLARAMDITVVNMNELAQVLRAKKLPGEQVEIEILQPGNNRSQAIGYLDDGTMVVIEDAKDNIGQKVKVEIQRSLQTEAGRMIFAKKVAKEKKAVAKSFHSENIKKVATRKMQNSRRNNKVQKSENDNTEPKKISRNNQAGNSKKRSDLKNSTQNNSQNKKSVSRSGNVEKPQTQRKTTRRKTSKAAENSMVALANKVSKK